MHTRGNETLKSSCTLHTAVWGAEWPRGKCTQRRKGVAGWPGHTPDAQHARSGLGRAVQRSRPGRPPSGEHTCPECSSLSLHLGVRDRSLVGRRRTEAQWGCVTHGGSSGRKGQGPDSRLECLTQTWALCLPYPQPHGPGECPLRYCTFSCSLLSSPEGL